MRGGEADAAIRRLPSAGREPVFHAPGSQQGIASDALSTVNKADQVTTLTAVYPDGRPAHRKSFSAASGGGSKSALVYFAAVGLQHARDLQIAEGRHAPIELHGGIERLELLGLVCMRRGISYAAIA